MLDEHDARVHCHRIVCREGSRKDDRSGGDFDGDYRVYKGQGAAEHDYQVRLGNASSWLVIETIYKF